MSGATNESRRVHLTRGAGSPLFVFVRDWTGAGSSAQPSPSSESAATGLSLLDGNGQLLADLGRDPVRGEVFAVDRFAACTVAVDPVVPACARSSERQPVRTAGDGVSAGRPRSSCFAAR